ncbi:MAG TPA: 4Fe-4S ferredoxin, partial [Thermodesulfobacteriota bacterium]|nr:4Fe-4S ferredoxin [Thermodesulfobacteriota bacterium]
MADKSLYRQLAEAVGGMESPLIQKIFEALVKDDEAKVLLAAAPSATAEELGQKTGFSTETIKAMMESLFNRGLIFKSKKGEQMKYYRVKSIPQMHDSTVLTPGISREVLDLWKKYMETEWREYGRKMVDLLPGPFVRVIPVNEG